MIVIEVLNHVLGLRDLTQSELLGICLLGLVTSIALGWFTDAVMGDAGFGVAGNAILSMLSAFVAVIVLTWVSARIWHRYPQQHEMLVVIALAVMFAVMSLLLLAAAKKVLARG